MPSALQGVHLVSPPTSRYGLYYIYYPQPPKARAKNLRISIPEGLQKYLVSFPKWNNVIRAKTQQKNAHENDIFSARFPFKNLILLESAEGVSKKFKGFYPWRSPKMLSFVLKMENAKKLKCGKRTHTKMIPFRRTSRPKVQSRPRAPKARAKKFEDSHPRFCPRIPCFVLRIGERIHQSQSVTK